MSRPTLRVFDRDAAAAARKRSGKSLAAVAGEVGMSKTAVARWESGTLQPDERLTAKLAEALGVKPAALRKVVPDMATASLELIRRSQRLTLADIASKVGESERSVRMVEKGITLPKTPADYAAAYNLSMMAFAAAWRRSGT